MDEIKLLDVVALLEDVQADGLRRGEVGTVVEVFAARPDLPGAFLVEFSDNSGEAYAFAALTATQIMKLHFHRIEVLKPTKLTDEARTLLDEGFEFLNEGDEAKAEKKFRLAIDLDPRSRGAILNSILRSFDGNDDWGAKIQVLRFMYHLAPDYKSGRNNLAIAYLNYGVEKANEGDIGAAQVFFNYAIAVDAAPDILSKIRENFAGVLTTLGIKEHSNKRYDNSVGFMRMACMVFPNEKTRHNLGLALAFLALSHMDAGKYDSAIPVFEAAEETGLILAELLNDYAVALVFEKRLAEAALALERALELTPNSHLVKENLEKLSKKDEALVPDEIRAEYIHIPTAMYEYQMAA